MAWSCTACHGSNPAGTRFCGLCGAARHADEEPARQRASDGEDAVPTLVADALRGLVPAPAGPAGGRAAFREDRRLVTALFADISGFSELSDRLDAEQLREIIDPAVSALSNVVGRYGGVIEKFAGDALMALFGAPVAHDDDASRALNVALDMHAELARLVPLLPPEAAGLRLHVGVNSGHGIGRIIGSDVRFDYGVLGDVVVLAQRLEAAAPIGETYVGDATYELTRKHFDFEPIGEVRVKGKEHPVRAWRLVGRRVRHAVHASVAGGKLPGREEEFGLIEERARGLSLGRGGAVFVVGEPGIGKTALCEALGARAAAAGWDWLAARCLSYGAALSYWPVADLIRRLLGLPAEEATTAGLEVALASMGLEETVPFIAALCGIDGAGTAELDPQTLQTRLHESVLAVLRARAAERSVVLNVDDLQWADPSTLALLREVLRAATGMPLLLLATARTTGGLIADDLAAEIPESATRIDLGPLGPDAVAVITASILGAPVDAALVASVMNHTRGNPFFVEEVTRSLAERGALVMNGGVWRTAGGWDSADVPITVEGVVAARVDALGDAETKALEVLSVVGVRADLVLARAVSPDIDAALPALRAAGLIDPPDEDDRHAAFHHPLTLQVVHSRLLRRRRADLHRAVGEAAETLLGGDDASVDLLARHFTLGERPAKAFEYALRAAERAERLFANEQAAAYIRQALDLEKAATGTEARRRELLLRCARIEEVRGAYATALSLYEEALRLGGGIAAAAGKTAALRKLGDYSACLDVIRESRAASPAMTPEEAARLALEEGWVHTLLGDSRRSIVILRGGLTILEGRDPALEADLLIQLARSEQAVDADEQAREHAEAARRRLEDLEDLPRLATALRVLGGIEHELAGDDPARLRGAQATLERALAVARRVGNPEEEAASLVNLGYCLAAVGSVDDAIRCELEAVAAFERVGLKAGVACALCNLAESLADAERWPEALDAAARGLVVAREIGSAFWMTGALQGIARARSALGDPAGACVAAEESAEIAVAHGIADRELGALREVVAAREMLGDAAAAAAARERLHGLEAKVAGLGG